MAAATTSADCPPTETLADHALIAEIAPAMLEELRNDGENSGRSLAIEAALIAWLLWDYAVAYQFSFTMVSPRIDASGVAMFVYILAIAFLPEFHSRRKVARELAYRRQNGKWRWDH